MAPSIRQFSVVALGLILLSGNAFGQLRRQEPPGGVKREGGDHGGGGDIPKSTEAQVLKAIEDVRTYIASDRNWRGAGVFTRALELAPRGSRLARNLEKIEHEDTFLEEIKDENERIRRRKDHNNYIGPRDYIGATKIVPLLDPKQNCRGPNLPDTDAAVSENSLNASMCIKVPHIQRLSPEFLFPEILGLMAHEIAHMNGIGTTPSTHSEAEEIRDHFANNYYLLKNKDTLAFQKRIMLLVQRIDNQLEWALADIDEDRAQARTGISTAFGLLEGLTAMIDMGSDNSIPSKAKNPSMKMSEIQAQIKIARSGISGLTAAVEAGGNERRHVPAFIQVSRMLAKLASLFNEYFEGVPINDINGHPSILEFHIAQQGGVPHFPK